MTRRRRHAAVLRGLAARREVWALAVVPASRIATVVHGVRLGRHVRARPPNLARVRLAPGGLLLRF